ncbi:MAG: hypothetical protein P4L57_00970 [Rhizomicrobium sp.]|nr:hypothetical protein [Rhizomicrobium sp.]
MSYIALGSDPTTGDADYQATRMVLNVVLIKLKPKDRHKVVKALIKATKSVEKRGSVYAPMYARALRCIEKAIPNVWSGL